MRSDYEQYFRRRLSRLVYHWAYRGPQPTSQAVLERIPSHWRTDAIFFLAQNINMMIIHPIYAVERIDRKVDLRNTSYWPLIDADIQAIVDASEEESLLRDRKYVSATSVAIALGRLAPVLKTTSLQIWGPK